MATSIPLWGALFTLVLMVGGLSSPGFGAMVDWLARRRERQHK